MLGLIAAIVGVAAAFAFLAFVVEPKLEGLLERFAEGIDRRIERRRRRRAGRATSGYGSGDSVDDDRDS